MEDFTITISSIDLMYFSLFMIAGLSFFAVVLLSVLLFCSRAKAKREEKIRKQREQEEQRQRTETVRKMSDLALRALYNNLREGRGCYTDGFIDAVRTEARRRGIR